MTRPSNYGERLLLAQHRAKLSQKELSARSGVSTAAIRRAIAGKFTPRIETTSKLAEALGVDRKWLAFGDDNHVPGPDTE